MDRFTEGTGGGGRLIGRLAAGSFPVQILPQGARHIAGMTLAEKPGSKVPAPDTYGISRLSRARFTAIPNPPMCPRIWLCRSFGDPRRFGPERDALACSESRQTVATGCYCATIRPSKARFGSFRAAFIKNATELRIYGEVCPLHPNFRELPFRNCLKSRSVVSQA
jgi:hypothetical protein